MPDDFTTGGAGTGNAENTPSGGGAGNTGGLTMDQVNQAINAALTAREKRLQKSILDQLTGESSPLIQTISELKEQITATAAAAQKKTGKITGSNQSDSGEIPEEFRAKFENSQQEIARLKKTLESNQAELQREKDEKVNTERRSLLRAAIEDAGFKTRAEAVAALHREKGIVKWSGDDGQVGKPVVEVDGIEIPYDQFLRNQYAKTEEAKVYMDTPLREGSGAGAANQYSGNMFSTDGTVFGKQIDSMSGDEAAAAFARLTGG